MYHTTTNDLADTMKLLSMTTARQLAIHVNNELMWKTIAQKYSFPQAPPFGKVKVQTSVDSKDTILKCIEININVNEAFYINITFTHFHLYTSISGCHEEKLTMTHVNNNNIHQDVYCGHLPQWTQLIANNTVTITYTSSLPAVMCTDDNRKPGIHFAYQVINMDIIDESGH